MDTNANSQAVYTEMHWGSVGWGLVSSFFAFLPQLFSSYPNVGPLVRVSAPLPPLATPLTWRTVKSSHIIRRTNLDDREGEREYMSR